MMETVAKLPSRKNYLLAIGIDKYTNSRFNLLFNAVHDVKRISDILCKKYDFELIEDHILNENATRETVINTLTQLAGKLNKEDNLVIYFAGHGGMTPFGHGYWVPVDGTDLPSSYIPNSSVKDAIQVVEAKHVFLISDSCYSGTFLTRTRAAEEKFYYDKLDALKSRWAFTSGGEEKVSDGFEPGEGSPFCNALYDFLDSNSNKHLSVTEIINYVSFATRKTARQQPMGAFMNNIGHEDGQMVLILKNDYAKASNDSFVLEKKELKEEGEKEFCVGKELLIIKSFSSEADYLIVELFRFDDNGNERHTFKDNTVRPINSKNGKEDEWELIQRFGTITGVHRYLDENPEFTKHKVVLLFADETIDHVENTEPATRKYKELLKLKIANTTQMNCLHCRKKIITNDGYFVEIDEEDLKSAVGNVHRECLRAADRILGRAVYPNLTGNSVLLNFDYEEWINLLKRGQGFITPVKKIKSNAQTPVIAWNPDNKFNSGTYCIRLTAEDGKSSFAHLGKDIYRIKESDIDAEVDWFKDMLKKSGESGDSMGVTSGKRIFGNISYLKTIIDKSEKVLKIVSVEKAKYSNQFSQLNPNIDNDYAPLALVINHNTEDIVNFGNCIPLISDPSLFDEFHKNWNASGYVIEKCELRIIRSDIELEHYLLSFLSDGMQPILDPLFDSKKELVKGFYISNFKEIAENKSPTHTYEVIKREGSFKEGQMVEVVFPDIKMPKKLIGVLITDEFEDENKDVCAIFMPIEDGKRLDYPLKMPVKLFKLIK